MGTLNELSSRPITMSLDGKALLGRLPLEGYIAPAVLAGPA
jgi:hypothetical protein